MNKSQKIHIFFYAMFVIFIMAQTFTGWRAEIPLQNALQYSEGYVELAGADDGGNLIVLRLLDDPKNKMVFECTYPTSFSLASSGCGDFEYLEKYINKAAKIGWYQPNTTFKLREHGHQIVTMFADGDYFKKYEQTKRLNSNQNKMMVVLSLVFIYLSYIIFIKVVYPKS